MLLDQWVLTSLLAPTHNLSFIHAAFELVGSNEKLHDAHPQVKKPKLPVALLSMPMPPKRKSAFLHTLSRLASPGGKLSPASPVMAYGRHQIYRQHTVPQIVLLHPRPMAPPISLLCFPPSSEINDPFIQVMSDADTSTLVPSNNPTITNLAAYLTSITNDQIH
jgi:hypothetical protein